MRAVIAVAVTALLAVAAHADNAALASDQITLFSECDTATCSCAKAVTLTHNNAANREYCSAGTAFATATGLACVAEPHTCGTANIYADAACGGAVNTTVTFVCNECMPLLGLTRGMFTCTRGQADLKLLVGCDASCGSCSATLDFTSCAATMQGDFAVARPSVACHVVGHAVHAGSACTTAVQTPMALQPQHVCFGESLTKSSSNGVKVECGGNTATSAALSLSLAALVTILSLVA
jgi:hypothetical protein